ncbi:MAG: FAD-binding protein [Vicinamibacteria bacterium]|nr:FAD-binding protein [Vicinamibacteria bacterium]
MKELRAAVSDPQLVSDAPEDLAAYAYDGTWTEQAAAVVAHPASAQEVAAIHRIARAHGRPIVPRGAATGLAGGAVPVPGALLLNLARMSRIREISLDDSLAVVEPGVVTAELQRAVEAMGLFYPPDPASIEQCTIGGNVATNAGGPRCLKYGVTGDYVLALEVVLASGEILRLGGRTLKDVAAYDLKRLFIGSEGTLGTITEITLRLIPRPKVQRTALAAFARIEDACAAVGRMLASGVVPLVTELMDRGTIQAVEAFKPQGLPTDAEALLLVAVDGGEEAVAREIALVANCLRAAGARDVKQADSVDEAEALWQARRSVSPAVARLARNKIGEDIAVPRSAIPEMVLRLKNIATEHDLGMVVYGHIGDGNLHPTLLCDRRDAAVMARVERATGAIFAAAISLGGTLTGEHGIGIFKRDYLQQAAPPETLRLMADIKRVFDPQGLMNPGKKLPIAARASKE